MRKEQQQLPWLLDFDKILSKDVLRIKLKVTKFGRHRTRGFRIAAGN